MQFAHEYRQMKKFVKKRKKLVKLIALDKSFIYSNTRSILYNMKKKLKMKKSIIDCIESIIVHFCTKGGNILQLYDFFARWRYFL